MSLEVGDRSTLKHKVARTVPTTGATMYIHNPPNSVVASAGPMLLAGFIEAPVTCLFKSMIIIYQSNVVDIPIKMKQLNIEKNKLNTQQ